MRLAGSEDLVSSAVSESGVGSRTADWSCGAATSPSIVWFRRCIEPSCEIKMELKVEESITALRLLLRVMFPHITLNPAKSGAEETSTRESDVVRELPFEYLELSCSRSREKSW